MHYFGFDSLKPDAQMKIIKNIDMEPAIVREELQDQEAIIKAMLGRTIFILNN